MPSVVELLAASGTLYKVGWRYWAGGLSNSCISSAMSRAVAAAAGLVSLRSGMLSWEGSVSGKTDVRGSSRKGQKGSNAGVEALPCKV